MKKFKTLGLIVLGLISSLQALASASYKDEIIQEINLTTAKIIHAGNLSSGDEQIDVMSEMDYLIELQKLLEETI